MIQLNIRGEKCSQIHQLKYITAKFYALRQSFVRIPKQPESLVCLVLLRAGVNKLCDEIKFLPR